MTQSSRVTVRIDQNPKHSPIRFGVPVRFRPVAEKSGGWRIDLQRQIVNVIAPVTSRDMAALQLFLETGKWEVTAVLPTGELLSDELFVPNTAAQNAEEMVRVVLRGESSPYEWCNWDAYAGSAQATRYLVESSQLKVSVGSVVVAKGFQKFDPSQWDSWFYFLQQRFERGSDQTTDIRLENNSLGLRFKMAATDDSALLRVNFLLDKHSLLDADLRRIGAERVYVTISGTSGTRLFPLPLPWGESDYFGRLAVFELLVAEDEKRLRCVPILHDKRWAGLIAYLNQGRVDLAAEILEEAKNALFGKFENPLAAAAGGYILLSVGQGISEESWPYWLENLERHFPYLPDGPILRARWLLGQSSVENLNKAHVLLVDAVKRGIPFFTTGVLWLIEGLEQTSINCPMCAEMLRTVRGVARSMDLSQAFTSFSISRPLNRTEDLFQPNHGKPPGIVQEEPNGDMLVSEVRSTMIAWKMLENRQTDLGTFRLEEEPADQPLRLI